MSRDRGVRPAVVVRMDNNGEILLACLEPVSEEELASSGVKFLRSQLELLVDWNLLDYDAENETYETTVHVYGAEKSSEIRSLVEETADELAGELDAELTSLREYLETTGREKSLFAVFYANVLHNYSMQQLAEEIYRRPPLSDERPFWNGYSWAVYPIRKFDVGVTALPGEEQMIFSVSHRSAPRPSFQQLLSLAEDVSADSRVDDPELLEILAGFGVCDDRGDLTIPVFGREWAGRLEGMAERVYAATLELVDTERMTDLLGMDTRAQAAMYLHYELRYAFLAGLLETGAIESPIDFDSAADADPRDFANMIFLVESGSPAT